MPDPPASPLWTWLERTWAEEDRRRKAARMLGETWREWQARHWERRRRGR